MEINEQQNTSPATERLTIEDLPMMEDMTPQEQKGIVGGGLGEEGAPDQN